MWMKVQRMEVALRWFGKLLVNVSFNSLSVGGHAEYLEKTRCRHATVIAPLANWYAARLGIGMRILTRSVWLRYEPLMYRLLLGRPTRVTQDTLLLPRLPGRTLVSLLKGHGSLTGEQELGLSLAVMELARLHKCRTPHPWHAELQQFSHADATIENVLVDTDRRVAHWIDFETIHEPSMPATMRHADDLLTLLCSAATAIPPEQFPRLCEVILCSYSDRLVAGAMVDLIQQWAKRPLVRRLAIPALTDYQWQFLQNEVRLYVLHQSI